MKNNRMIAAILIIIFLISLLCSTIFIINNVNHQCTGDKCPICHELEQAVQFISNIKFIPILSAVLTILCVFTRTRVTTHRLHVQKNTLISLKVEMLN